MKAVGRALAKFWRWLLNLLRKLFGKLAKFWRGYRDAMRGLHGTPPKDRTKQPPPPPAQRTLPPVGDKVAPASGGYEEPPLEGEIVSGSSAITRILNAAEEMAAAAATYEPQAMKEVIADMDRLPEAVRQMAVAFRRVYTVAEESLPVNHAVKALVEAMYLALNAAVEPTEAIGPLLKSIHADDIEKMDARNQEKWDVTVNRNVD